MNNDLKSLPARFQLEGIDVWLRRFENKIDVLASHSNSPTKKTSMLLYADSDKTTAQHSTPSEQVGLQRRSVTPESENNTEPQIYLRTLLEFLLQYYDDCMTCLTPGIISLFPLLIEYANEDENESNESFKDIDIRNNASSLVHESMSSLLVNQQFAESFPDVVVRVRLNFRTRLTYLQPVLSFLHYGIRDLLYISSSTYYRSCSWRARASVLKFLQVLVFSNIYTLEKFHVPKKVVKLLFEALKDRQVENECSIWQSMFVSGKQPKDFLREPIYKYQWRSGEGVDHGSENF
ncbi:hypothetical protein OESDEN_06454 [Oesophagostomum dentatum]|uniref:Proteasome activator Blm10 mid region domain-containing protein n=1 Tax=Oesophagostomum dentatum TaxID=61180 RepID=A0A0B1T7Z3_OESDE|nr:hypothetical protein OESDEN_06454 [Oesophagostomum dentatum]